jgi:plastocyanin
MKRISIICLLPMIALSAAAAPPALAEEASYTLTLGDKGFEPGTLEVSAGKKISLIVKNEKKKPAEFESVALNREKVIPPGKSVTISIGPLTAGTYSYFDDFDTSHQGTISAK